MPGFLNTILSHSLNASRPNPYAKGFAACRSLAVQGPEIAVIIFRHGLNDLVFSA